MPLRYWLQFTCPALDCGAECFTDEHESDTFQDLIKCWHCKRNVDVLSEELSQDETEFVSMANCGTSVNYCCVICGQFSAEHICVDCLHQITINKNEVRKVLTQKETVHDDSIKSLESW